MTWWQTLLLAALGTGGLAGSIFAVVRVVYQAQAETVRSLHETTAGLAEGIAERALKREEMIEQRLAAYREETREDLAAQRAEAAKWRDRYDECDRNRIEMRARIEALERQVAALTGEPPRPPVRSAGEKGR